MDSDLVAKCRQMFEMSVMDIEGGNPSMESEVIVALWTAMTYHFNSNEDLQRQVLEYSTNEQQKRLTEYYHQVAILETQLAQANKEIEALNKLLSGETS